MLPRTVPLSKRMIFTGIFFSLFTILLIYGIYFISTNTIYMEDNTVMPFYFKIIFISVFSIILLGTLFITFPFIKRIITKTGAMTIDKDGIHNTFICFGLFAFTTIIKINFIPWTALKPSFLNPEHYDIDKKSLPLIKAGFLAKILLKITGYNISIAKISKPEFDEYLTMYQNPIHI